MFSVVDIENEALLNIHNVKGKPLKKHTYVCNYWMVSQPYTGNRRDIYRKSWGNTGTTITQKEHVQSLSALSLSITYPLWFSLGLQYFVDSVLLFPINLLLAYSSSFILALAYQSAPFLPKCHANHPGKARESQQHQSHRLCSPQNPPYFHLTLLLTCLLLQY